MTDENIIEILPKGRTAFLMIHGVGEQNPLETLDYFTQNLLNYFQARNVPVKLEHLIAKRRHSPGNVWVESFIRLSSTDTQQDWLIDIHEYYWANQTDKKISVSEILQWAEQTLQGTIKFYERKENKYLFDALMKDQDLNRNLNFKYRIRWLTIFLRLFNFIYPILRLGLWLILFLAGPFLGGNLLQSAWKLSKKLVTPPLVNFVGDVAIYSITDIRSNQNL
jgi:hypothetical protein